VNTSPTTPAGGSGRVRRRRSQWRRILGRPIAPPGSPTLGDGPPRICVVGSGWRFVSGISVYSCRLANAFAEEYQVSVILMRRLLPRRFYPGADRVGADLMNLRYRDDIDVLDGVDYFWFPSMVRAVRFLLRRRPEVVLFEWWSGTVLHSYLALAIVSRLLGARIVIEFHEILDTAEASRRLAPIYVRFLIRPLLRLATVYVVHSEFDQHAVRSNFGLSDAVVVPHGPFDHVGGGERPPLRDPDGICSLLFFGTIRPYKGLEHLIEAFGLLSPEDAARYRLVIVGETWEGWDLPAKRIASSPHRSRITFVNRYVHDDEAVDYFAAADAVVLPYLRSSSSGPLHLAMSWGLPVVVSDVGGLREAAGDYQGVRFVRPADVGDLRVALLDVVDLSGYRYEDSHSWARSTRRFGEVLFGADDGPTIVTGGFDGQLPRLATG
jgi:glycosyltransferase involved in cell wall biosynthesis